MLKSLVAAIRSAFPKLVELYDSTASLQDRTVDTGRLKPELARRFGAGGFVGRASGRSFDARRDLPYPPYDLLKFDGPHADRGRRQRPRLDQDQGGRTKPPPDRADFGATAARRHRDAAKPRGARPRRRPRAGGRVSRRRADLAAAGAGRPCRALPPARPLLAAMAAAGSGDRGRHRRGFPAVQQVVQLLLRGARPLSMIPKSGSRFLDKIMRKQEQA